MTKAYLVHLNELEFRHVIGNDSKLKGLVTQKLTQINAKGKDQVTIKSFHHFIVTTNKPNPVPTSSDDRRNIIWECSREKIGNKAYFNELYKLIEEPNVLRTVWDFFKKRETPAYITSLDFPLSPYHEELKLLQKDPLEGWLEDYTIHNLEHSSVKIKTMDLWFEYKYYMSERNFKMEHTNYANFGQKLTQLGKQINDIYPLTITLKKANKFNARVLDIEKLAGYFDLNYGAEYIDFVDDPE